MLAHAQGQRFDTLRQQEGIEGADRRAQVTQGFSTQFGVAPERCSPGFDIVGVDEVQPFSEQVLELGNTATVKRVGEERNVQSMVNGITCAGQLRRGDPAQARSVTNVPWVLSKQRLIN